MCFLQKETPKSGQAMPPLPDRVRCVWSTPSRQADVLSGIGMPSAHPANSLPTPMLSSPTAQAAHGLPPPAPSRAATHRFLGMVPDSGAAGVAAGDAPAADAALRALHSLVLGASWGRPSRWPDRTRSRRRARPASGSRSLAPASPAAASAMASALCRRPRPLGSGERSLRAAPRATIRCGASRQSPRRLAAGALRLELQRALSPPTVASPRPSPPRPRPPPRLATPRPGVPAEQVSSSGARIGPKGQEESQTTQHTRSCQTYGCGILDVARAPGGYFLEQMPRSLNSEWAGGAADLAMEPNLVNFP